MNLLRAAATISSYTLLSRITGLVRDVLIARAFGAGSLTDAFWVAFRIPNLLRRLFAEGAFSQAFVPILGEVRNRHAPEDTRRLLDHVASLLTFALLKERAQPQVQARGLNLVGVERACRRQRTRLEQRGDVAVGKDASVAHAESPGSTRRFNAAAD